MPKYIDSLDKIVFSYFAAVTKEAISFKGKIIKPVPLRVSPSIFKGYRCFEGCGACCSRFSLEYLPSEKQADDDVEKLVTYIVEMNGRKYQLSHDPQDDHEEHFCRYLDLETGACLTYETRPFTCDFELLRVSISTVEDQPNALSQKLYGRGWNMTRIDGEKGAQCELIESSEEAKWDVVRKLIRLEQWTDHFQISTWIPEIIEYVKNGPVDRALFLERGGFL